MEAVAAESNLHAAFQHASANGRSDLALPLAALLGWFLYTRGHLGQGRTTSGRALALADGGRTGRRVPRSPARCRSPPC